MKLNHELGNWVVFNKLIPIAVVCAPTILDIYSSKNWLSLLDVICYGDITAIYIVIIASLIGDINSQKHEVTIGYPIFMLVLSIFLYVFDKRDYTGNKEQFFLLANIIAILSLTIYVLHIKLKLLKIQIDSVKP